MAVDLTLEFPQSPDLLYLNHAAVSPWPARTARAVATFADENMRVGARNYPQWRSTEDRLKCRLARMIQADSGQDIALLKSTSEGISLVASGLDWQPGDEIVIAREEFPSNRIAWQSLAAQGVNCSYADLDTSEHAESALLAQCTPRTRLISVSSVQYGRGLRMDLDVLGAACKQRGILLCVDAIQSLGALPFSVRDCGADFVVADGHKWMLGAEGLALFWCRPDLRNKLKLQQFGWHMTAEYDDFDAPNWRPADSARRFECGSPNMLGIHALDASLELLEEVGMTHVAHGVLTRSAWLHQRITESPRLRLLSNPAPERRSGIVTFCHESVSAADLHRHLRQSGVICAARGGGVRFSPHFYTPVEVLERAVALAESRH